MQSVQDYYSPYTVNQFSRGRVPARISRSTYLLRWVLLGLAAIVASLLMDAAGHASHTAAKIILMGAAFGVLLNCVVALFRSILIPRVRDVGLHPAWSLLILLHSIGGLFVLALLFIRTDAFARPSRVAYY